MITGRVWIGIAHCPRCGGEVYLDSVETEDLEEIMADPTAFLPPRRYRLVHDRHEWDAESFEIRQVFAMEMTT